MSNSCYNPFIYGFYSAKFNQEFRKILFCLPCVEENPFDTTRTNATNATKQRAELPGARQPQSTTSQLRRINCQHRSPNASPLLSQGHQPSRPVSILNDKRILSTIITNIRTTTTTVATSTIRPKRNKFFPFFSHQSNNHTHQNFFANHHHNYYSSQINRSISNCEKFLPDHDLSREIRENDLLLVRAKQRRRSV